MSEDDGLLSRWSRRKRKVAEEAVTPEVAEAPASVEVPEPETEEDEAALLETLGLPRPESLKEGDDFSAFMEAGVPEFLRKRALRVLWRSNPVLANLDGLNDYDEDFTSPEMTQKVLATAYKVGRGFVRDIVEAEEVPGDKAEDDAAPVVELAKHDVAQDEDLEVPEAAADRPAAAPEEAPAHRPRRMRFET